MVVQKSDAMVQHEKWIAEVVAHRPKRTRNEVMRIDVPKLVLIGAAIAVVIIAVLSMM
ncbi:MAG: hypothetical protein QUS09_05025 [Methanotrichaceae archaeon]|nr:hypothetical protein [Methanotrichaceae archaeon]